MSSPSKSLKPFDEEDLQLNSLTKNLELLIQSNQNLLKEKHNRFKSYETLKKKSSNTLQHTEKISNSLKSEISELNHEIFSISSDIKAFDEEILTKDRLIASLEGKLDILNPPDLDTIGLPSEWKYLEGKEIEYEVMSPMYDLPQLELDIEADNFLLDEAIFERNQYGKEEFIENSCMDSQGWLEFEISNQSPATELIIQQDQFLKYEIEETKKELGQEEADVVNNKYQVGEK